MRRSPVRHQNRLGPMSRAAAYAIVVIALSCIAADPVSAAPLVLRALDFSPVDVSADGSVVTGGDVVWNSATGSKTVIGRVPGFHERVGLPEGATYSSVRRISADGSVVVGTVQPLFTDGLDAAEAFRWTATTGTASLGTNLGGQDMFTSASGVSADGSVVAGRSWGRGVNGHWDFAAFRWTANTGMIPLPDMHSASAVSDDGSTVVGNWSHGAVRWTAEQGTIRMGALPGHNRSGAWDVSADGSVVVGASARFIDDTFDTHLFRWTAADGMTDLGLLATVPWLPDLGISMSADGNLIVGHRVQGDVVEPFIWDELHGMRPLSDVLTDLGVDLSGWDLESVTGISGDGRTFIGYGVDPTGSGSGWIVTVPEPAGLALLAGAGAGLLGIRRMQRTAQLPWRAITTLAVLACAAAPATAEPNFSTVALSGQPAPGMPGVNYRDVYSPSINDTGHLVFGGTLERPGGAAAGDALFGGVPDALNVIARSGSPAPGLPPGSTYANFRDFAINNTGHVAFLASVSNSETYTLFSGPLDAPTRVAWSGDTDDATYLRIDLNDAGEVAFQANRNSILAGPPNALGIVARSGSQAPGLPAGVRYAELSYFGLNNAGQVIFPAKLEGHGLTPVHDSAIFAGKPGSLIRVAQTGRPAPGMPPGVTFEYLGGGLLNNNEHVAFSGRLAGTGLTGGNDAVIYVGPLNSPSPVVRTGDPAPGTRSGVSFEDIGVSALNDAGQFTLWAYLQGPVNDGWNDTALYVGSPDALVLVAREGSQAPGTQPGVNFARWPGSSELNDRGQLAFRAGLTGTWEVEAGWGLFLYDPVLGTSLIARTGELFDVGGGDLRRIEDFSYDYRGGALGDDGRLAFSLTFTDGSSGVFVATVPEPAGLLLVVLLAPALLHRHGRRRMTRSATH